MSLESLRRTLMVLLCALVLSLGAGVAGCGGEAGEDDGNTPEDVEEEEGGDEED